MATTRNFLWNDAVIFSAVIRELPALFFVPSDKLEVGTWRALLLAGPHLRRTVRRFTSSMLMRNMPPLRVDFAAVMGAR